MIKHVLFFVCLSTLYADNHYRLMIIGDGVAGLSAAIYGGNARIPTAVVGLGGGQLARAGTVENMPGVDPQQGITIIERLKQQAQAFGAHILEEMVTSVTVSDSSPRFRLTTQDDALYTADALIITTGSRPRTLNVPGEYDYWGRGVSTCAVCDCLFTQDKDVVIVGGGDSAIEEALQLAPYARSITMLLRGSAFRASPRMQEKLAEFSHITYRNDVEVLEVVGDATGMTGAKIINKLTHEQEIIPAQGLFLAIGHIPENGIIKGVVDCDPAGFIKLISRQETSVPGIFAAGDITDNHYRQAIIASGDAAKAALDAIAYLRGIN